MRPFESRCPAYEEERWDETVWCARVVPARCLVTWAVLECEWLAECRVAEWVCEALCEPALWEEDFPEEWLEEPEECLEWPDEWPPPCCASAFEGNARNNPNEKRNASKVEQRTIIDSS